MMEENQKAPQDGSAELDWFGRTHLMNAIFCSYDNRIALELIANGVNINAKDNGGNTALMYAVIKDNKEIVSALLHANAKVNDCNNHGRTALFKAVDTNNKEIADMLIKSGADMLMKSDQTTLFVAVNHNNNDMTAMLIENRANVYASCKYEGIDEYTSLMLAAKKGNLEIAKALLHAQANVNTFNMHMPSALFLAVDNNNKELVELLIENDADVNLFNCDGFTALMVAVKNENIEIVRVLLQAKADVNASIPDEKTALFLAIIKDNREIVELLIESGADVNLVCKNLDDEYNYDGFTPLMAAVENENIEIVRVLLQAKADVNPRSNLLGETALLLAVEKENRDIVELLIKSGADVNLFYVDTEFRFKQFTPLMLAVRKKNIEIVRVLLQAKADVNARGIPDEKTVNDKCHYYEFTPLLLAVWTKNIEIVRVLLQAKAAVNASNKDGKTALHVVFEVENDWRSSMDMELVKALIGALTNPCVDVNVRDNAGRTALFYAVRQASMAAVQTLINAGAEVNIKDNNSQTPLFYVGGNHGTDLIALLIKAGANLNERNNHQESALFTAVKSGNLDVVKALFHAGADLNARNIYGRTPLFYTTNKSVDVVAARFLLENGAQFNQTDSLGFSVISCFTERLFDIDDDEINEDDVIGLIKEFEETDKIFTSVINILYRKLPYSLCSDLICTVQLARKSASNEHEKKMIEKLHNHLFEKNEDEKLPKMFDLLHRLGADPNSVDSYGNTALHYAVKLPCWGTSEQLTLEIIGKLEEHGARANAKNHDGHTPLLCCLSFAICGHLWPGIGKLVGDFYLKEYNDETYCRNSKTINVICKHLLQFGPLANEVAKNGESVFHILLKRLCRIFSMTDCDLKKHALQDTLELMKLFSPPDITQGVTVNKTDDHLKSPLHLWASLSLLSENGCRNWASLSNFPKYEHDSYENNISVELSFESLLKLVFNHLRMCGIKLNARDEEDQTPLHYCQTWSAVQCLVEAGAKRNDIDSMGRPPLLAAAHKRIFMENPKQFFPDVTYDPKSFFKKCIDMGLDLWDHDNDGESILSLLLSSQSFELAQGLVESACEEKTSVLGQLLVTICKDQHKHTHWKSSLVGKILACPKGPQGKDLDDALHSCCLTMKTLYEQQKMIFEKEKEVEEPPFKKAREDTSFRSIHNDSSNSSAVSVHLDIANQLRVQGANSERCIDLCANIEELKTFLTKAIDYKKAPLSIPWTSYSHNHVDKLERIARRHNVESINSYWYHKEPIGSGSFGDVFAGISQKDGREIAIKKIVKRNMNRPQDIREITTLTALADCNQVVNYIYFDDTDNVFAYVVLELMEGNLDDYLNSSLYDSHQSLSLCQDLIMGLKYLHEHEILHRDLKPQNILYKAHPNICAKIADFGLSSPLSATGTTVLGTTVGTRCWIAPEVWEDDSYKHTKESDSYSCGLLLHYIVAPQMHPFCPVNCGNKRTELVDHKTQANMLNDVMEGFEVTRSPAAAHLIRGLLSKEPDKRPSAADSLFHPLFWSNDKKMDFLCVFSGQPREGNVTADIQNKFATIVKHPTWDDATTYPIIPQINEKLRVYREYNKSSILDLIAFIRNAKAHESSLNATLRKKVLDKYVFLEYFPHLVIEVYKTVIDHGWDKKSLAIKKVMSKNENTR